MLATCRHCLTCTHVLQVSLREGRNLPVWGLPWQSNPWCTLRLGGQVGFWLARLPACLFRLLSALEAGVQA